MFTLDNFYQSREWVGLMQIIKQARVNEEGFNICEYCHKPIIKAYDCIGHHKQHLTNDNVNDYNISLNPDNVALVHHVCHNKIHNKLGYVKREIFLVYGSPLAGKTSYVDDVMSPGDLIIDIDNIWQCVSGLTRYTKPQRLNAVVFGIRDYLIDSVKIRRGKWNTAYIIGGYPLISERERICRELGAREIFIDTPKDVCIDRLNTCQDDRNKDEWRKFIDDWWRRYTPPL